MTNLIRRNAVASLLMRGEAWQPSALRRVGNGVKGGKWYSLMDKVVRPTTLEVAWRKVARNRGAAGVDGYRAERVCSGYAGLDDWITDHSLFRGDDEAHFSVDAGA